LPAQLVSFSLDAKASIGERNGLAAAAEPSLMKVRLFMRIPEPVLIVSAQNEGFQYISSS
jgi:hypothetical protein